jgi:NAD(P)-dependent dehydrogenase (short-subunit alcohol dehydrogenase family)
MQTTCIENVVLTARDKSKGLAATEQLQAQAQGLNVIFHPLEVTDAAAVQRLARYLDITHGRCDILVNNAGIALDRYSMSVLDTPVQLFRDTLETNVYGPLMLCQALVPLMLRRRYGRVVNLSSGMGQLEDMEDGSAAYRMSKTVLNALTCMVAAATAKRGILVNALCPGWVRTDMGGRHAARGVDKGAETAIWLATLPANGPTGGLFRDKKAIAW